MLLTRRVLIASGAAMLVARPGHASAPYWYINRSYAADGADVVAYFSLDADANGVRGSDEFVTEWNGAMWSFASAENKATFEADPEAYAPQFGGYCAWAVSQGYTAHGDRNAWSIKGGKLYLNFNNRIRNRWLKDPSGFIAKGEANWPNVLSA